MSRLGRFRPNRAKLYGPQSDAQEITGVVAVTLDAFTTTSSGGALLTVIRNPAMSGVNR